MERGNNSTESVDRGSVSADVAARYAFLKAVSQLPHSEVFQKPRIRLYHTIEAEILPRLILAHRASGQRLAARPVSFASVTPSDIQKFFEIILLDKLDDALAVVVELSARGVSIESILLDVLAPTATKLGAMWEEDDVDFLLVTVALGRLQQVLRHLSGTSETQPATGKPSHRALLAAVPGETHIFSLLLVDQFFRADGWNTWTIPGATRDELIDLVSREAFALVGLSISCDIFVEELRALIPAIRQATTNKALQIMVGGPAIKKRPELALEVGADGTATDGALALVEARRIVESAAA